jgi:hypothetical protein
MDPYLTSSLLLPTYASHAHTARFICYHSIFLKHLAGYATGTKDFINWRAVATSTTHTLATRLTTLPLLLLHKFSGYSLTHSFRIRGCYESSRHATPQQHLPALHRTTLRRPHTSPQERKRRDAFFHFVSTTYTRF